MQISAAELRTILPPKEAIFIPYLPKPTQDAITAIRAYAVFRTDTIELHNAALELFFSHLATLKGDPNYRFYCGHALFTAMITFSEQLRAAITPLSSRTPPEVSPPPKSPNSAPESLSPYLAHNLFSPNVSSTLALAASMLVHLKEDDSSETQLGQSPPDSDSTAASPKSGRSSP